MSLATADYRVVFFEEPVAAPEPGGNPSLVLRHSPEGVLVATPSLPNGLDVATVTTVLRDLLDGLLASLGGPLAVSWYYTPLAFAFAGHLRPASTVYDCMDELSLFRGASPQLTLLERQLLKNANLVFAGGRSLYELKRQLHAHVHLFPSSLDAAHFGRARLPGDAEPSDQLALARPRIGYFGVVDERIDYALLDAIALARPDWQFIMLGPTVKVDPATLPQHPNLHWLGMKQYADLPDYLRSWDVGMMPFALNEATRFISPTKTPEFLAAGVPLVSTAVPDVLTDWGNDGLVEIADGAASFVLAIEALMVRPRAPWLARVDQRLKRLSWTNTWSRMNALIGGPERAVRLGNSTADAALAEPNRRVSV
jgi:glycosyltransferase involved in cell wall biosynthesis